MPRIAAYRASENISSEKHSDAYTRPSFSVGNRARRLVWKICWLLLYRPSPRPLHGWRSFLLRRWELIVTSIPDRGSGRRGISSAPTTLPQEMASRYTTPRR